MLPSTDESPGSLVAGPAGPQNRLFRYENERQRPQASGGMASGTPSCTMLTSVRYLGWQESLTLLAELVEAEIPD